MIERKVYLLARSNDLPSALAGNKVKTTPLKVRFEKVLPRYPEDLFAVRVSRRSKGLEWRTDFEAPEGSLAIFAGDFEVFGLLPDGLYLIAPIRLADGSMTGTPEVRRLLAVIRDYVVFDQPDGKPDFLSAKRKEKVGFLAWLISVVDRSGKTIPLLVEEDTGT